MSELVKWVTLIVLITYVWIALLLIACVIYCGIWGASRWVVKFSFKHSSQIIHTYFHNVFRVVLKLHGVLLAKPSPVTDDFTHPSWKHFKGCLGALDGTLNDVTVPEINKARYRTQKGTFSVNVLDAYDRGMCFTYMLAGWGGSATDERILRDVIARDDGLRVPHGNVYLCDNGYPNGEGFLTPYKMVFPNTNLKPEPHINSRITVWKRNYHSLFEILKNTGVGLDSTTNMIEATDEQWDAFMKKDPNTRLMRSKSWPLYDDWCGIFDQSRVIGETAESHLRATTPPPSFSANIDVDDASFKVGDEKQDESKAHIGCAQTGETAQRIGHDQDMAAARKMIYTSVSKMNMLTLQGKLRATALIARNAEDIDVFFTLPNTDHMEWVMMLLNGDI
ncbi:hypothetical protein ACS0TY_029482 [Phlomoides rotata]